MISFPANDLPTEGTYTVVGPKGGHRTLVFEVAEQGYFAGKTIIGFLNGPDNSRDFTSFAATTDDGQVRVWRKFEGRDDLVAAARFLTKKTKHSEAGLAYALQSSRCCRCGRKLTVPTSLYLGMGADCAKKAGVAADMPPQPQAA